MASNDGRSASRTFSGLRRTIRNGTRCSQHRTNPAAARATFSHAAASATPIILTRQSVAAMCTPPSIARTGRNSCTGSSR